MPDQLPLPEPKYIWSYTGTFIVFYQPYGDRIILTKDDSMWSGRYIGHWTRDDGQRYIDDIMREAGHEPVPNLVEVDKISPADLIGAGPFEAIKASELDPDRMVAVRKVKQ